MPNGGRRTIVDYLNENVAINLKKIRKAKKMSLETLSTETGISKSMLGQIERGETNPTVTTLGKLVSGLRVGLMELLGPPHDEVYVMRKETLIPVKSEENAYRTYAYFPYSNDRDFEIYSVEIEPGGCYPCSSHGEKTAEYNIVFAGRLTVEIGEKRFALNEGDAIRMDTDKPHFYYNLGNKRLRFYMLFTWK